MGKIWNKITGKQSAEEMAKGLDRIRKERIAIEGKAKLAKIRSDEERKIREANKNIREYRQTHGVQGAARRVYQEVGTGYTETYKQSRDIGRTINRQGGSPAMLSGGLFMPRPASIPNKGERIHKKKGKRKEQKQSGGMLGPVFRPFKL